MYSTTPTSSTLRNRSELSNATGSSVDRATGSSTNHAARVSSMDQLTPTDYREITDEIQATVSDTIQNINTGAVLAAMSRLTDRLNNTENAEGVTADQAGKAVTDLAEGVTTPVLKKVAEAVSRTVLSSVRNAILVVVVQPSIRWSSKSNNDSPSLTSLAADALEAQKNNEPDKVTDSLKKIAGKAGEVAISNINHKFVPIQAVGVILPNESKDQALIQIIKRNEVSIDSPLFNIPPFRVNLGMSMFSATEDVYDFNVNLKKQNKGAEIAAHFSAKQGEFETGGARGRRFNNRIMVQNHHGTSMFASYGGKTNSEGENTFGVSIGKADMEFRQRAFHTDTDNTSDRNKAIAGRLTLENTTAAALGGATYGLSRAAGVQKGLAMGLAHTAAVEGLALLRPVYDQLVPPSEVGTVSERDYFAIDMGTRITKLSDDVEVSFLFIVHVGEKTGYEATEPKMVDLKIIPPFEINSTRESQIKRLLTKDLATAEVVNQQLNRLEEEIKDIQQVIDEVAPAIEDHNRRVATLGIEIAENGQQFREAESKLERIEQQRRDQLASLRSLQDISEKELSFHAHEISSLRCRLDNINGEATILYNDRTQLLADQNQLYSHARVMDAQSIELEEKRGQLDNALDAKISLANKLLMQQHELNENITGLNKEAAGIKRRKDKNEARAEARKTSPENQERLRNQLQQRFEREARFKQEQHFKEESKKDI